MEGSPKTNDGAGEDGAPAKVVTLPPPEWTRPAPHARPRSTAAAAPIERRTGRHAEEASIRARLAAATEPLEVRELSVHLARWLASHDRDLDEAVALARRALASDDRANDDPDRDVLRRELAGWLECIGHPKMAASELRDLASRAPNPPAAAAILVRAGVLYARAGDAASAADALDNAARLDPAGSLAGELMGTLSAWAPEEVPADDAARSYAESGVRHAAAGERQAELDDLVRAFEVCPTSEIAALALAAALVERGKAQAADVIICEYARHLDVPVARPVHGRRRADAIASGDVPRALGAALDGGLDAALEGEGAGALDDLLLRAGLLEPLAARLEIRALRVNGDEERARLFEELARLYAGPLASPARSANAHVRALAADPAHKEALIALRAYASSARDPMPLAEALIRAISSDADTDEGPRRAGRLACARTLATVADEQLGEVGVAAWALERVVWLSGGDSMAEAALARCTPRVAALLEDLEHARKARNLARDDDATVDALRKMALLLRALPGRADELAEVLGELVRRVPGERRFAVEAARIGWRRGDLQEVTRLARARLNPAESAADKLEARSVLAAAAHAAGDAAAANEATRTLLDDPSPSREAVGAAWMNAALAGDHDTRARALAALAGSCAKPLRAILDAVAAEVFLSLGNTTAARASAERACHAEPQDARAVAALASTLIGATDRTAASALERAINLIAPSRAWCSALADALDAMGEKAYAVAWTQRLVSVLPGDRTALQTLLARSIQAKDGARLSDALVWVLSQPQPGERIVVLVEGPLRALAEIDPPRAVDIAHRALDVLGAQHTTLRSAVMHVAERARDQGLAAALLERWVASGASPSERPTIFAALAERRAQAADADGEARALVRAIREGVDLSEAAERIIFLTDQTLGPDGELWWLEARAQLFAAKGDPVDAARAWRELGGARWDMADDRPGALRAWLQAAKRAPSRGYATLAFDLGRFATLSFALDCLSDLVERETDPARSGMIAGEAARAALALGSDVRAFELAALALQKNPALADALEVAEQGSLAGDYAERMSELYDAVGRRALGRFGRRAAHYRGARFFENRGNANLSLKHAAEAFTAVPSEGCTFVLLARAAERAEARHIAVRAVEQVAELASSRAARSAWILRAASLAGDGEEGARQRCDLLLRAVSLAPDPTTLAMLGDAAREVLKLVPEDREVLQLRLGRASGALTKKLDGPEGARVALSFAELGLDLFEDAEGALLAFERALGADGDLDEFARLVPRIPLLATSPTAAESIARAMAAAERPYANVGPPALKVIAGIAVLLGDGLGRARALTLAIERDQDEDALVCDADTAILMVGDEALRARFAKKIDKPRWVEAWRGRAREELAEGRHDAAVDALERAAEGADAEVHAEVQKELGDAYEFAGRVEKIEERARSEADDDTVPLLTRAERWMEIAHGREMSGDLPGAIEALAAATKIDPGATERWIVLERVAELANDGEMRIAALNAIAAQLGGAEAVPPMKRLARVYEGLGRGPEAEATWMKIWALATDDDEVDPAIEALVVARADYVELAEHLARRADRIASRPGSREGLRAVRLRRAAILEQRLGRPEEACAELERLLVDFPDNESALSYLADLRERTGDTAAAIPLLRRVAGLARDPDRRCALEMRAARASMAMGLYAEAIVLLDAILAAQPGDAEALELRVEIARSRGDARELGDVLDSVATASLKDDAIRTDMIIEAAQCAARARDAATALERARRAARIAPERAKAQLFARGLEYRLRGSGTPVEARETIEHLARIREELDVEDAGLMTFLVAEALDVVQGGGAGMRKLTEKYAELGPSPLLAVGLAERHVTQWNFAAAVPLFDVAIRGNLMGLRKRGQVALAAADAALRAERLDEALKFLAEATTDPDTRIAALRRSAQIAAASGDVARSREVLRALALEVAGEERARILAQLGRALFMSTDVAHRAEASQAFVEAIDAAPSESVLAGQLRSELDELRRRQSLSPGARSTPPPAQVPVVSEPPAAGGDAINVTELESAVAHATDAPSRAAARLSLAGAHLAGGRLDVGEKLLWDALTEGSLDAGDTLASLLEVARGRSSDLLKVRRALVEMAPGDLARIESLAAAASADHNTTYARALEHVVRAFDPGAGPLPPPPLAVQNEQPGMLAMLTRHSHEAAGEALALAWEGASSAFSKTAAAYSITGLERVVPGPSSPLARLYETAIRLLDTPPIPLFVRRSISALTGDVALLSPAAAILTGNARDDSGEVRYALGQALSAALPQNALILGLPENEARVMWNALIGAFGPPELGRNLDHGSGRLAETFWQVLPSRAQRRMTELLASAHDTPFERILERAHQSGRRVALFLTGDFGHVARAVVLASGRFDLGDLNVPGGLASHCAQLPALTDLLRLAVRPEYADARWHPIPPASARSGAAPSSRFRIL